MPTVHTPLSQPHPCPGQQGSKTSSKHLPWEHRQPSEVSSGMEPPGCPSQGQGPPFQAQGIPPHSLAQGQHPQSGFTLWVRKSRPISWELSTHLPHQTAEGWGRQALPHALPPSTGRLRPGSGETGQECCHPALGRTAPPDQLRRAGGWEPGAPACSPF